MTFQDLGTVTYSGSASALNADLIPSTKISGYQTASIQITGTFVGTITFQGSNNNTDFENVYVQPIGIPNNGQPTVSTTSTGIYHLPLNFEFIRIRMTSYTSGTATATVLTYERSIGEPIGPTYSYTYFHPIFTTRVQSASNATGALATSLVIPISSTQSGNLIAVSVSSSVAGTVTCTDNLSQTYSTAISGTSGTHTNYIFYKANTAPGATSLTITSTTSSGICAIVTEYFGVITVPLDKTSTGTVTGVTSFSSGATATTTSANELLLGSAHGITHNNSTYTAGTSWNSIATIDGFNAGAGQLFAEDQYVQALGAYTATGTASANDTIIADIATFILSNLPNLTILNQPKVIKTGTGVLTGLVVNTIGTGSATATLYDGIDTTGTVIAVISLTNSPRTFEYDVSFTNGLTMVLNSTTADITVVYA